MGDVVQLDFSKRKPKTTLEHRCEDCRFFKLVITMHGKYPAIYRLCASRKIIKKPDPKGIVRAWRKIGDKGEGYFVDSEEEELALDRCFNINPDGQCLRFKYKILDRLGKINKSQSVSL